MKMLILAYVIFFCLTCNVDGKRDNFNLNILSETKHDLGDKFLSVGLDTVVLAEKFINFNMTNEKLLRMCSYLAPAYIRIGGNLADRLHFSEHGGDYVPNNLELESCFYDSEYCSQNFTNFTMTASDWDELNRFASHVGFTIVFDLNALIRKNDGSWDSKNAEKLIEYSNGAGYDLHWQLGNEPDSFKHKFNYSVNATQLAKDFTSLKTILQKYPRYKNSLIIGPDITRTRPEHKASAEYLENFLNTSKNVVNVVSLHQYYLNGHIAQVNDFLNPKTFELLIPQLELAKDIMNKTGYNNTPVWLGETSSAYGGGAPDLSDNFVGSFLWLDKLGIAAKYGLQTVVRQSLVHGYYALINNNYEPNPDWWISVIYKRTVGSRVVNCSLDGITDTVRVYCHCSTSNKINSGLDTSAVTVFGVNINDYSTKISIKGLKTESDIVFGYIFTTNNLKSNRVYLNGDLMKLSKDGKIPHYTPVFLSVDKPLVLPPYSLVFWVIPVKNMCIVKSDISVTLV